MQETIAYSRELGEFCAEWPSDRIPETALKAARRVLLDGLGVMIAASGLSSDVAPFAAIAGDTREVGSATILGWGQRAPAPVAAFANGAMAHALDYEDSFDAAPCHPNASLLPAVLALTESAGPISGRQLLEAIVIGCDVSCRMALALTPTMEEAGWYPPPLFGLFGATAAAGRLLGLDARRMLDAFSLALCQAGGPGEIKHVRDTVIRAVREAFPAQAAVLAALLARNGVRGFDQPFEGRDGLFRLYAGGRFAGGPLLEDLGTRFHIETLSFKPWPTCRGTHAYIEAAFALLARHPHAAERITEIRLTGGDIHRMLAEPLPRKRAPATAIDAKFSLPFTVATAFRYGAVDLDSFTENRLTDPAILSLAGKVEFATRPGWGHARAASGIVELRFEDGSEDRAEVFHAKGHPNAPLDDADLGRKFVDCAARGRVGWNRERALSVLAKIETLDAEQDAAVLLRQ